jgi:hypothetical protein
MNRIVLAALLALATGEAHAIVRYMVQGMTCAEVKEALDRDGVGILFRQGQSGVALYGRYVKDVTVCAPGETTSREYVEVADTDRCPVNKCMNARRFGG